MTDTPADSGLAGLLAAQLAFRDDRDWAQFHDLRSLIVSTALEAGELLELTQWTRDGELEARLSEAKLLESLEDECADVLLCLLLVAERAGIDLVAAAHRKIAKNALKYPVEKCRGRATKYTEL